MKNIVLVGQSPAIHAAVKKLLDRDPSLGLTLLSVDGQLPYDRMLLPGLIDRSIKEKDIFCAPADYYAQAQVQVVLDKEITRINFTRSRIFCVDRVNDPKVVAQKAQYDFDTLFLMDAPEVRLPSIKGVKRQGVFHLARLSSVKDLIRFLTFTETVIVEPLGFAGIRAALALKAVGKDVILASRHEMILSNILSPERSRILAYALEKRGVRVVYTGGSIDDILGEAEVKAVRYKTGKVVACDMVVLEDAAADIRFIDDAGINMAERVITSDVCQSNVTGVYAMDAMLELREPKFTGGYWMHTDLGVRQADVAISSLYGGDNVLTQDDLAHRDMIETFFHSQEIHPVVTEVTL